MKKPIYFYQILSSFIIIGLIIIILFNSFSFRLSRRLLNEQLNLKTQENVHQIMNTLEQRFQSLDRATHSLMIDSDLRNIIREPLSSKDINIYYELISSLNYIASFGPGSTTVDLISLEEGWSIQNGTLDQLTASKKVDLLATYSTLTTDLIWINGEENEENHLARMLPFQELRASGFVIIRIPLHALATSLYRDNRSAISANHLLLYNGDQLIYRSHELSDLVIDWNTETTVNGVTGRVNIENNENKETFIYANSFQSGWTYYLRVNKMKTFKIIQPIVVSTVLATLIMLILLLIIGYLNSHYFSKPNQSLQKFFSANVTKRCRNEFESINYSIREVNHSNQGLEAIIRQQSEQLGVLFIINVFYGVIEEDEVSKKLKQFSYPNKWKKLSVCVIQIDTLASTSYKKEDIEILLFAISSIVKEMIDPTDCLPPTVIDSKTQTTIMLHQTDYFQVNQQKTTTYFENIQRSIKARLGLSISVGISNDFEKITDIKQALKQGREALNHRINKGKECLIFHKEIMETSTAHKKVHFPTKLENQLMESLKQGNRQQSIELLNHLLAEIFKHNKSPVPFELCMIHLLKNLIDLMTLLGIDSAATDDQKTLYFAVSELKTPEEIEIYLKEIIIYPLLDTIKERENGNFKTLSDQIIAIVQNEFDTLITLDYIANQLGYNPNYLSYLFKKEYSQSFSEYLAFYRHDMAKKWLRETNRSVKQISEQLQYSNSQNFIRSFRKIEGTTPGDFRKAHQIDVN